MPRLPDRFDLWVRKARESTDPVRQVDWILGALIASRELYFFNVATATEPQIARAEIGAVEGALVFTEAARIAEFLADRAGESPVITSPTVKALEWCEQNQLGLMINPGVGETAFVPASVLAAYLKEWKQRGERQAAGFWIPNMTSEEEDFWQEHGL